MKVLITFLVLIIVSQFAAAEKITLTNGEWAPYMSEKLKHYGYISRVVKEAFAEEGVEVQYVFLPWKRAYEEAKIGKYQGSIIWGINDERAADFLFSDTVAELGTGIFHKKGKAIEWNKPEDLGKYKIGGVVGYAYGIEELEKQGVVKLDRIPDDKANYKKLSAGRIDIVLEDTEVGYETITNIGLKDEIIAHPKPLMTRQYSVIISKKAPNGAALVEKFNKGLKKLVADGRYQKYVDENRSGAYK